MIVKNEEDVLERCLNCMKDIADEIIIADTGSTDLTKEIALKYTNQVYDFKWIDDFSAARNFTLNKATKDYVMWLDADDIIDLDNQQKLKELKDSLLEDIDVVMMKYQMAKNGTVVFYRERLLKRKQGFRFENAVHEVIVPKGNIFYSDITIIHQKEKVTEPLRNLKIYEKQLENNKKLSAREMFYYARELKENKQYQKSIDVFRQFLNMEDAWVENKIEACLNMYHCFVSLNQYKLGLSSLFESFDYDLPRSEILCEIGNYFFNENKIKIAIYWYELALKNTYDLTCGGFVNKDCYDYIPYIQLCVCYDCLKEHLKAQEYNEKAGDIKPDDESYLHNKKYFMTLLK